MLKTVVRLIKTYRHFLLTKLRLIDLILIYLFGYSMILKTSTPMFSNHKDYMYYL